MGEINENAKRDYLVGEEIYRMIVSLSVKQETAVIELLKQLLHCDKSAKTPSFPLSNKSLVLEVKAEFRLLEGEWVNINASEQEILQKEIKKSVQKVKKFRTEEVPIISSLNAKNSRVSLLKKF